MIWRVWRFTARGGVQVVGVIVGIGVPRRAPGPSAYAAIIVVEAVALAAIPPEHQREQDHARADVDRAAIGGG